MKFNHLLFSTLLVVTGVEARVMVFQESVIENARKEQTIASQILIVKSRSLEVLKNKTTDLGMVEEFFTTSEGQWSYLKLSMIPDALNAEEILFELSRDENILHAYFAPIAKNAIHSVEKKYEAEELLVETPDLEGRQTYLQNSPVGVDAVTAWNIPGGTGKNVKVIDIETCFEDEHEDFERPFWVGSNSNCSSTNHGTAVWGEIASKRDGKGVTGIVHEADFGIFGFAEGDYEEVDETYIRNINSGIQGAIQALSAGDVLVIEQQMVGPDLRKYTAVEYWPHIFDQLKAATKKGIHCLQAAGNGSSDFDDPSYQGAFDLTKRDSGCVMVGAVDQLKKERLSFSNYGSRLDAAGYGQGVVTTGYGDLFNGGSTRMYTARFSGTSSATPIVAGAVAAVSSIARERGVKISPLQMRQILRETGIQQGSVTINKRTGSFPSILQMLRAARLL